MRQYVIALLQGFEWSQPVEVAWKLGEHLPSTLAAAQKLLDQDGICREVAGALQDNPSWPAPVVVLDPSVSQLVC
jgi:hypothetical protein